MRKLKPNQYINHFSAPVDGNQEANSSVLSTIIYNPIYGIDTEEYSDSSVQQREIYLKSRCREAEIVIATLSKMFEGDIHSMEIEGLELSVACILKTRKSLSQKERSHILSISRNLEIT